MNKCNAIVIKTKSNDGYLAKTRAIIDSNRVVLVPVADNESFSDYKLVRKFRNQKLLKQEMVFWTESFEVLFSRVLGIIDAEKTPMDRKANDKNRYKIMNRTEKIKIKEALAKYCERKGGQNKAANTLQGVSAALVSQVLNENWDLISDAKWRTIASQIGYTKTEWVGVETVDYKLLTQLLKDAQENAQVYAVTASAGSGKTYALKHYEIIADLPLTKW